MYFTLFQLGALTCIASHFITLRSIIMYWNSYSKWKAIHVIAFKTTIPFSAMCCFVMYCNGVFCLYLGYTYLALIWPYGIQHSNKIHNLASPLSLDETNTCELNPFLQGLCCYASMLPCKHSKGREYLRQCTVLRCQPLEVELKYCNFIRQPEEWWMEWGGGGYSKQGEM